MSTAASLRYEIPLVGVTRAAVYRALVRSLQLAAVGILSFALLVPFLGGVVSLLRNQASACSMSCCKGSKICCCHSASQPGLSLTAAGTCPGGCGQRAGLPGSPAVTLAPGRITVGQVAQSEFLQNFSASINISAHHDFALFERPPPLSEPDWINSTPVAGRSHA